MSKIVVTGATARNRVIKGANFLVDCVKQTLGPWGSNGAIEKGNRITNDGVTIASEIELEDEIEQRGLSILREACFKTVHIVGDGTTSALVLAQAVLQEAVRYLPKAGLIKSKMTTADLTKKIDTECKEIIAKLVQMATPIESEEQLIASALVSVEDKELADLIGKTQFALGKEGVIIAEETQLSECTVDRINGIRIDNGLAIPGMMNNLEKQCVDLADGIKVIITNHTFHGLEDILKTMNAITAQGISKLVLIGRGFSDRAVKQIYDNLKAGFTIIPVSAPYVDQAEVMKDLAALLGGRFIDCEQTDQEDIMASDCGYTTRFIGRRYDAIFAGDSKDEKAMARIAVRINELEDQVKGEPSDFERRNIEARLAQLKNGFGLLRVGADSDVARKYKKDKADDAVSAVRAAFQEGVVPGAGLALKLISDELPDTYILKKPICAIYEQIKSTAPEGFEVPDWVKDPVKVQRIVLEKACSVAATLATISTVIATRKEKPRYVVEAKQPETVPEEYR